ncbi:MAG: hypothetical protein SOZ80_00345, partial [Prevotella sp.]|uniref:hypothetical protein n=1 Tax=Prevotella sp. TaxID=59823 RepID=UPI002A309442
MKNKCYLRTVFVALIALLAGSAYADNRSGVVPRFGEGDEFNSEGEYEWVKDASTLKAGDELIFVYQNATDGPVAMGKKNYSNFAVQAVGYTVAGDKKSIEVTSEAAINVCAIKLEGEAGSWSFKTKYGYLVSESGSGRNLKVTGEIGPLAQSSIVIADNGDATIKFAGEGSNKIIKYYYLNGTYVSNENFSCYPETSSSFYNLIQIYRKASKNVVPTIKFTPESNTVVYNTDVTISVKGAENFTYKLNGGEDVTVSGETATVKITTATTIEVTATNEYGTSNVTATYNVKPFMTFDNPAVDITYGDNYNKQEVNVEGFNGKLVYSSSDENIVKFHGNNVIDILSSGVVTITATAQATETSEENSASYVLRINMPADVTPAEDIIADSFDYCEGKLPDGDVWSGTVGSVKPKSNDWIFSSSVYAGNQCLVFNSSLYLRASATKTEFTLNGSTTLSFDIAPWVNGTTKELCTVTVELTNATFSDGNTKKTFNVDELNVGWNNMTFEITGNSDKVKVLIEGTKRFFLDNFKVGNPAIPACEINLSFGSAGYLTWVATDNIDFENTEGVTAYQITDATAAGITAQEVAKVP